MADSPADNPNDVLPLLRIGLEEADVEATVKLDQPAPAPASGTQPRTGAARGWEPPSVEELQHALPQYEVQAFIARGGMGAVYRGVQRSLGRTVAIKILPPDADDDDEVNFAERFKREARAMASLSHPGIVAVHDAGEVRSGGTPAADGSGANDGDKSVAAPLLYFVMEYIEGTDVAQLIASEGRLEPARALGITAHVCDALAFAHESGIVHRDIKPSNIMLDRRGRVKVADFGLAKTTTHESRGITLSGMAMGTPDFVAPETLVAGTKVDQRADIYAVGVMLYQMLTGEIPRGRFELPSQLLPQLDARLDAVIDKAMQRDREKRYSSALDLRADLDAITATPMALPSTVGVLASGSATGSATGSAGLRPAHPTTPQRGANEMSHLEGGAPKGAPRSRRALIAVPIVVILGIAAFLVVNTDKPEQGRAAAPPAAASGPAGTNSPDAALAGASALPSAAWDPAISRRVAEQALKLGANSVVTNQNGKQTTGTKLPEGDFRLVSLGFPPTGVTGKLTPADLLPLLDAVEVEGLTLQSGTRILNEEACRRIAALPNLKRLNLQGTNLQDDWLEMIGSISKLEDLNLAQTKITDAEMAKLAGLQNLRKLFVSDTKVTGEAIAALPLAAKLQEVTIAGNMKRSGDADLEAVLKACTALEWLNVESTVSAASLEGIGRLRRLNELLLKKTTITPAHVEHLATAPLLAILGLGDCRVEDAAWAALPSLKQLTTLNLKNVPHTPAMEAALKQFNPPLKVVETSGAEGEAAGQALRLPVSDAPATAGGAPALQAATASRYPVGQWVRPFQKAADINQKWFDAGARWEEGWITPGAGFNQGIVLAAPNGQGRNWGARAKVRWSAGFVSIVLRRNGDSPINTWANYDFRVSNKGAEFQRSQGRGSVSGSDRKPLGDPFPIPLTEGQEVLIEAFAIGDTLYGRVDGKVFTMKTDGVLKEGGFEVATQIMAMRGIEFINLDGQTEAEARKAAGLE